MARPRKSQNTEISPETTVIAELEDDMEDHGVATDHVGVTVSTAVDIQEGRRFLPDVEVRYKSVDEAINGLNTIFDYGEEIVDLGKLTITPDYALRTNGHAEKITETAFDSLLGLLNIPRSFGRRVPNDLLEVIVHRLREIDSSNPILLFRNDHGIINMRKEPYERPTLTSLLREIDATSLEGIACSYNGMHVTTLNEHLVAEPIVGDTVKIGLMMTASETGGALPHANLFTYRLVCSNGAVAGNEIGSANWSRGGSGFEKFLLDLEQLMTRGEHIVGSLSNMSKTPMSTKEFANLWLGTTPLLGAETSDIVFGVDKKVRTLWLSAARLDHTKSQNFPTETSLLRYDVFNALTAHARDLPFLERERLMRTSGRMLN